MPLTQPALLSRPGDPGSSTRPRPRQSQGLTQVVKAASLPRTQGSPLRLLPPLNRQRLNARAVVSETDEAGPTRGHKLGPGLGWSMKQCCRLFKTAEEQDWFCLPGLPKMNEVLKKYAVIRFSAIPSFARLLLISSLADPDRVTIPVPRPLFLRACMICFLTSWTGA